MPVALHHHALLSILAFCALADVSRSAAVDHTWQKAALATPILALARLGTKLNDRQLDEVTRALKQRQQLREANGPRKETVLQRLRAVLVEQQCMQVGGDALLACLSSAEVTRKHVYDGDSSDTRIRLRLPAIGENSNASDRFKAAPAPARHAELQLTWMVSDRSYESDLEWSILWHSKAGMPAKQLLHFSEMIGSSGDPDGDYTVLPLAAWLRECGVLPPVGSADARQQYTLLWLSVEALFQLADSATAIDEHVGRRGGEACAKACGYIIPHQGVGRRGAAAAVPAVPPFSGLNLSRYDSFLSQRW